MTREGENNTNSKMHLPSDQPPPILSRSVPHPTTPPDSATMPTDILTHADRVHLFKSYDSFLFDCDGVIWEGDRVLEGVHEAMAHFRAEGKKLIFVTNNATKSRAENKVKFDRLGIECHVVSLSVIPVDLGTFRRVFVEEIGFFVLTFELGTM